jgi:hypothetical protein
MAEVTAQPPVDVDFAVIAQQVARRDKRVRRGAAGSAALAVAAIVAVTAGYGVSRTSNPTEGSRPFISPAATVDATWRQDSWSTVSWRTPAGWLPSAAYPDHSRPSNDVIEGPYIGTARMPVTSPSPRPVLGTGVLGSAGPVLPPDAVVAWFTYGQRSTQRLSDGPPFTDTTPDGLKTQCVALGADAVFHAVRHFGTQAHGSNLALDGCLSGTGTALFYAQLAAVLASATDSAYLIPELGPSAATTAPSAGTAETLCASMVGTYASAELTTVDQIRTATWGPALAGNKGNLADAFLGAKGSDPAAWCWQGSGDHYTAYAVHAGDTPVEAGSLGTTGGVVSPVPSGQPLFP